MISAYILNNEFQYLGLGVDVSSFLKQEVDHLAVTIVTRYDERGVS